MTKNEKLAIMKERLNRMENLKADANIKCGGCRRKLERQIRNAENQLNGWYMNKIGSHSKLDIKIWLSSVRIWLFTLVNIAKRKGIRQLINEPRSDWWQTSTALLFGMLNLIGKVEVLKISSSRKRRLGSNPRHPAWYYIEHHLLIAICRKMVFFRV